MEKSKKIPTFSPTFNHTMAKKSVSKNKKAVPAKPVKKAAAPAAPIAKPANQSTDFMELKDIQELIRFVSKSGVSEVELETKGVKLVIKTGLGQPVAMAPTVIHAAPVAAPVPMAAPAPAAAPAAPKAEAPVESGKNLITIKSPMIGTFYRQSGPDKPAFVQVGDEIKPGKVLCIIEAMKLFNEIESEVSGRIVKVMVDDATPVEYDQPLFMVEPA